MPDMKWTIGIRKSGGDGIALKISRTHRLLMIKSSEKITKGKSVSRRVTKIGKSAKAGLRH
jgi:hypothetical protein